MQKILFEIRLTIAYIVGLFEEKFYDKTLKVFAGRVPTTELVNRVFNFCEVYCARTMFPYQEQFSKRIIRSVLMNDGAELTALFARQSGKSETVANTIGGLMIILPQLANMPMFADDPRLEMFKDGLWVGIFAPSQRQAQITYRRIQSRLQCRTALQILQDPEFRLQFSTSNGQTVSLTNGSFATAISASDGSNIEGESFKLIICEECLKRGTKIKTSLGERNIEDIKVGDSVLSYNHTLDKVESKKVLRSFSQPLYNRKIVTLKTESGKEIVCTDNHKIFISNKKEYARADSLHVGDYMLSYMQTTQESRESVYEDKSNDIGEYVRGRVNSIPRQKVFKEPSVYSKSIRQTNSVCLGQVSKDKGVMSSRAKDCAKFRKGKQTLSIYNKVSSRIKILLRFILCGRKEESFKKHSKLDDRGSFGLLVSRRWKHEWNDVYSHTGIYTGRKSIACSLANGEFQCNTSDKKRQQNREVLSLLSRNREKQISETNTSLCNTRNEIQNRPNRHTHSLCSMWETDNPLPQEKDNILFGRMSKSISKGVSKKLLYPEKIVEIVIQEHPEFEVFDLTVEDNHNFFACDCLVHNCQDISNFKLRKCLTGDTRVLLSTGEYKRLDSVVKEASDSVVCFNKDMQFRTSKIPSEFYDNGIQDVYEISLDNGESIKATLNHQFYTLDKKTKGEKCKYRTLQQIQDSLNNDIPIRVGVPDRLPYFAEEVSLDYEKGLILGYLLGDGCLVGTPKFIGDIPTCQRLHETICKVFGEIKMTETNYNPDNGMQEVCFSTPTNKKNSNPLTVFLKEMGVQGLTRDKKCLPDKLFSQSFYIGYIEGLIETDGCIESCTTKPIVSFANVSLKMVKQLKDIYLKFGIHSTLFTRDNSKGLGETNLPLHLLHVKSVLDIQRFSENFVLFRKQSYLNEAVETITPKGSRELSKYYSEEMRFCRVKSIVYVGKEPTYCLKVEGRNFIANNIISSNSIHPMGAAYNATIVKIGTSTTFKGDFYDAIQRNKAEAKSKSTPIKNHFEYDCSVASKYNAKYAKYVESERKRLGENSDEFQMSYLLKWIIERGMFVDLDKLEKNNMESLLDRVMSDRTATHVAGIDLGGKNDDTVITMTEVNWDMPVIMESRVDEDTNETLTYLAYNTYIKDWLRLCDMPDYEEQYPLIMDYLSHWKLARVVCDATRESSVAHRIRANISCEVIPFIFTPKSKSEIYKNLDREIVSGRARICAGRNTICTEEYQKFTEQLGELQKGYSGQLMVVAHPDVRGAHDDFPDSWALSVWGCMSSVEVDNTSTSTNKLTQKSKNENVFMRRQNSLIGKRR